MIVISWDGHEEINDGVHCTAVMSRSWGLPALEAVTAERHGVAPVVTGVQFGADHMLPPLQIQIEDKANANAVRAMLHRWFDGKDGRARPLVVADGILAPLIRNTFETHLGIFEDGIHDGAIINRVAEPYRGQFSAHITWQWGSLPEDLYLMMSQMIETSADTLLLKYAIKPDVNGWNLNDIFALWWFNNAGQWVASSGIGVPWSPSSSNWQPITHTVQRPASATRFRLVIGNDTPSTGDGLRQRGAYLDELQIYEAGNHADLLTSPRSINAVPLGLLQMDGGAGYQFVAQLKPDGISDPHHRWQEPGETAVTWNISASGQTLTVQNEGQDETYPTLSLKPTSAKTTGYAYKRWIPIRWRAPVSTAQYPVEITGGGMNTATLVAAGKMKSNGDDIAVEVNGARVNRWLGAMNSAQTKVWIPLSFQYIAPVQLTAALTAEPVDYLTVSGNISALPPSGICLIGNEAILYASKADNKSQLIGITRGAHGTTAANHSAGATVELIQHSVYLLYGNPSASYAQPQTTPPPAFDLAASTNMQWHYTQFGENAVSRMGGWSYYVFATDYATVYSTGGAPPKRLTSPWEYLGIVVNRIGNNQVDAHVIFDNVCGIEAVNITSGEMFVHNVVQNGWWTLNHYGTVNGVAQLAASTNIPTTRDTVLGWSQNISLTGLSGTATRYHFWFQIRVLGDPIVGGGWFTNFAGMNTAVVSLKSVNTPLVSLGNEMSNYSLAGTLTNTTAGHAVAISFSMTLNQSLQIDTRNNTVTYLADGSSQGQAVRRLGASRPFWLPLLPGENTLRFDDAGTTGLEMTVAFRKRYYF